jgi:hypothetical protein
MTHGEPWSRADVERSLADERSGTRAGFESGHLGAEQFAARVQLLRSASPDTTRGYSTVATPTNERDRTL